MTDAPATPKRGAVRRVLAVGERFLAIVGLFFLVYHFCFRIEHMSTGSMSPTLKGYESGRPDWVLIEKPTYWFRRPRRWEVAHVRLNDGTLVAKRIAALPGERITIQDRRVCINGVPQPPPGSVPYLKYVGVGNLWKERSFQCSDRGFFVLGDGMDSLDSRYEGEIDVDRIRGRILMRVWPPRRIAFLTP